MSTKIYNGMRFKGNPSLADINRFYLDIRQKMKKAVQKEYTRLVADLFETMYVITKTGIDTGDYLFMNHIDFRGMEPAELLKTAEKLTMDMIRKSRESDRRVCPYVFTAKRNTGNAGILTLDAGTGPETTGICFTLLDACFDLHASMSILPIRDKVLMIPYSSKFLPLLTDRPELAPYPYWDNTDPDEDVSAEEWLQREKDWEEALPGIGVPAEHGFTIDFRPEDMLRPRLSYEKEILPLLHTPMENARKVEKEKLTQSILSGISEYECQAPCLLAIEKRNKYIAEHPEEMEERAAETAKLIPVPEIIVKTPVQNNIKTLEEFLGIK